MNRWKNKGKLWIKTACIFLIVITICLIILILVDDGLNGSFADWFYHTFMIEETKISLMDGREILIQPDWKKLKRFLVGLFITGTMGISFLTWAVAYFNGKKKTKETISFLADVVYQFGKTEKETHPLPKEYAEIEIQLARLRTYIQKNQRMMESEMQRKNDLITFLAHDLKTPLASVIGYLSLLDEVPDLPLELRAKYTGITLEKAYRLEQLINEFFDIIRFNFQTIIVNYERIHLSYMLEQMADEFFPLLDPFGKTVKVKAKEDLILWGDADKMARVFNNILKNAAAYSYENTTIDIEAYKEDKNIVITFSNKGNPIPGQKLETIFEKFYRLDSSRSSQTGGAGLGLAIAKEIVTAHQGEIHVRSKMEKTVFTVKLPYSAADEVG